MPPLADKRASAEYLCGTCAGPVYSQGLETFKVPMAMFAWNRARLTQVMVEALGAGGEEVKGLILLEGGKQTTRYDTDHEPVFRQESYFHWLFGASEFADCYGTLSLPDGEATLFVPTYGVDVETLCGPCPDEKQTKEDLGVERVLSVDKLQEFVAEQLGDTTKLHLLKGLNSDSGNFAIPAHFEGIEKHGAEIRDEETLFRSMAELRATKTPAEIELMRYTNWVSSMAHVEVMRACRPGMMEYQLESLFQHHTYTHGGCRHMAYTCICACGPSANILHYGHAGRPNNGLLRDGNIALLDMGSEYNCYTSDITCSYPVNGKFTPDQRAIFEAVLNAQVDVIGMLRPGASWLEMHRTAERAVLRGLVKCGVLKGDVEAMIDADLGAIFMPHGLGHLIGVDTHDVGGYAEGTPERSERPGLRKLRTARDVAEGMVLTVEPGCYFIDPLIKMALANEKQSVFFNVDRLKDFRGFGGVRLEDDVVVTKDGCDNLTLCPRSVEEVSDVMAGGSWPPALDTVPELKRRWATRKGGKMEMLDIR